MTDCIKMGRESVLVPGNRLNLFTGFYLHDMFMDFDEIFVGVGNICIQSGLLHVFQKLDQFFGYLIAIDSTVASALALHCKRIYKIYNWNVQRVMQRLKSKMGSYFRRIRKSITIHVLCYDTFRWLLTDSFIKKV